MAVALPINKREEYFNVENKKIPGLTLDLVEMHAQAVVVINGDKFPEPVCVPFANVRSFVPYPPSAEDERIAREPEPVFENQDEPKRKPGRKPKAAMEPQAD